MDEQALEALDASGYVVLDAISHAQAPPGGSLATPHSFVCMDGRTYWVKAQAQQGLVVELIAGRLAAQVGAGPEARIIRVPTEALPPDGSASHLGGVNVGTLDLPGMVNVKDLSTMGVTAIDAKQIDADARARVVAFQSWIAVGDTQCMIDLTNGNFVSIDHGESFSAVDTLTNPTLQICDPPGLPRSHGAKADCVSAACDRIESVSDEDLLRAVACVPSGAAWNAGRARRLKIAEWLAHRRDRLREVMKGWT